MKTTKLFFMAALALTFAACSSDDTDLLIPDQPLTTDGIPFKATISTGTSGTRGLTPDGNDLVATWEVGEKVALIHNGVNDEMTVSAVSDDGVATIEGTITGNPNDGAAVTIIYPSTAADGATGNVLANLLCFQTSGTLADVAAKYDVRKGNGTLKVDGTASLNGNVSLDNQNAIFKFTIKNAAGSATIDIKALAATIGTKTYVTTPASATSELYFVLPAVTSQEVSFAAVGNSKIYAFSKTVSFDAGKYYQSTLKMSETDVLPGKFTINGSGDQIRFSPGNLRYVSGAWSFFDTQYGYYNTYSSDAWDKFGWVGKSSSLKDSEPGKWGVSTSTTDADYGTIANENMASDWGNVPGIGTDWRTLTKAEWDYLFNTRTASKVNGTDNARYTEATINTNGTSVNGVILFPDVVTIAADEATTWGTINGSSDWGTQCTTAQWSALEAKGCVFLPAAGYRDGSTVSNAGSNGRYWSSSPYADNVNYAYNVYFDSGLLNPAYNSTRHYGYSVRLIRPVK